MATHVLLVDDDEDDAQFFSDALKELSLNTHFDHCLSGNQALQQLTNGQVTSPDIIFLDVNMPAMNGWDCLREIKNIARLRHIPIVMYSTANLCQGGLDPGDVGAAAFYQKSNSFNELKRSLSSLIQSIVQEPKK